MPIIGLIPAWAAKHFIGPCIEQALYACDEVIVSIGAHSTDMLPFEDGTLDIAKKYEDKITLVPACDRGLISQSKAATMNAMLAKSKLFKAGVWIWLFDVDEFYFKHQIDFIKFTLERDVMDADCMLMEEKYFYINMHKYCIGPRRFRTWKVRSSDEHFLWTNFWSRKINPDNEDKSYNLGTARKHHYSMLLNPYAKIAFWKTEHTSEQTTYINWINQVYLPYDFNNWEHYNEICKSLCGRSAPIAHLLGEETYANFKGQLFDYDGPHPEFIPQELIDIKDFRQLYTPPKG